VVPTVLGYDARLQVLHEDDLLGALHHATLGGVHGTFNVAGDGVLMLSQAVRRLGKPTIPVPTFALGSLANVSRQVGVRGLSAELAAFLTFGRGVDTRRMREVLGFEPTYSTAAAFWDFTRSVAPGLWSNPPGLDVGPREVATATPGAGGGDTHG
jgi:UDP-glucose 4-epimerase